MTFRPAIKGVIRFSYPADGGFAQDHTSEIDHEAFLYDGERLKRRFHLFEALTLPSLRSQTDKDFSVAVLVGENLPDWARQRLEEGISDIPQARIIPLPRMAHYPATRAALEALPDAANATHVAGFRLDDDDAMHKDTVARIREIAHSVAPVTAPDKPFAIGFNRGAFLTLNNAGNRIEVVGERAPIGIGLTLVVPIDQRCNIFRRNHRLLHQFYDCFTDANRLMFIRSVHEDNDSGAVNTGAPDKKISEADLAAQIEEGFGLSLAQLKGL